MEPDEKVWEILMSADKKDYEQICIDHGLTDFRGMLKKLNEMKREREEEIAEFVTQISTLKHIAVNDDDCATIELDMDLKDPASKLFLYKDGVMIPFSLDESDKAKHSLKQVGKKYTFKIHGLGSGDAGLYSVDVGGVNVFSTDFKVPEVDFAVKIQEVKAEEREDALFQCVLTAPMNEIAWYGKSAPLSNSEKYEISVSEDKLIHKLIVRDCLPLDAGIYAAVAGIKSCNCWLVVEDLIKIAKEQQERYDKEMVVKLENAKKAQEEREAAEVISQAEAQVAKKAAAEEKAAAKAKAKAAARSRKASKEEKEEKQEYEEYEEQEEPEEQEEQEEKEEREEKEEMEEKEEREEDPGVHFHAGLSDCKAIIGEAAELECKVSREECQGIWYKDGDEIKTSEGITISKDGTFHRLKIHKVTEEFGGKYKFEADGRKTEALILVEDPPRFDAEELEAFKTPVTVKKGQKATFKLPYIGRDPIKVQWYLEGQELADESNIKIEHTEGSSRLLLNKLQRKDSGEIKIKLKNEFGTVEALSQLLVLAYPGPPSAPKVVSAFKNCINLSWTPPSDTGGTNILGYNVEKRKKGSNLWGQVNPADEMIRAKVYGVKDVVEGMEYEFRVAAINDSGAGEHSSPSEFVFARDPKKPPGNVIDFKVTDSTYTTLCLSWTKPKEIEGVEDEAKGYFVEIRPAENTEWDRCNSNAITMTSYTVKGMKSMAMYWVRVHATNDGGDGPYKELDNYILAMPPPVRPRFTDAKIKSFMVVRAGNSARINMNFEASPWPDVTWLKDGMPVSKKVTISNAEATSQLLIPSSERADTGIYTIIVKNIVGQETFSIEMRVTDEPKPPGPLELDENVPGTVTISWDASPDEKRDDRLHYMVMKRDSNKRAWHTIADHIFNNKFTACNILPGREYQYRVYAKNDMGSSKPSESAKWLIHAKKQKFTVTVPETRACNLQCAPRFIVPLKMHTAPQGYECYMSCAVKGDPTPHVTWLRDNISLNTNTNYFISNTCGVCSLLILRVGTHDTGEYKVVAESSLGRAECATKLTVRE
ncbi:immunoglobulin-like and fibronectin type III domain-containing protein 1 [Pleuronectes platessa]|uniref:immunoglobulin-like and fibronectin type III domain-containing protein 1 n=1 Tax=Pleuronectes platessa TaxID=8262 RepID=UPI00232A5AA7|nr:immunoglobulin-like and fibronectin type III domain-containing protein 1 [Pleuronectes platessa]